MVAVAGPRQLGRYAPIDPVCFGTSRRCPNRVDMPVSSLIVGQHNGELLEQVCALWVKPTDTVLDVTYGEGSFWKWEHPFEVLGHDLNKLDGVDFLALPEADDSQQVLTLDPPYRPTHSGDAVGEMAERYGLGYVDSPETIEQVLDLYRGGIREAFRVLERNGKLLVKTQDLSYMKCLHLVHLDVLQIMLEAGFDMADQFILGSTSGARRGAQYRAHRRHSYMWVGIKP